MELIKNKYEGKVLFDSGIEQNLTFHYNSEGTLSVQVRKEVDLENGEEASPGIAWDLNFTKDETANLVAFLHHIEIL